MRRRRKKGFFSSSQSSLKILTYMKRFKWDTQATTLVKAYIASDVKSASKYDFSFIDSFALLENWWLGYYIQNFCLHNYCAWFSTWLAPRSLRKKKKKKYKFLHEFQNLQEWRQALTRLFYTSPCFHAMYSPSLTRSIRISHKQF